MSTEVRDMILEWFQTIHDNLDKHFPTRFNEKLVGQRGIEIDSVNDEIARCERCIEYIKEFM